MAKTKNANPLPMLTDQQIEERLTPVREFVTLTNKVPNRIVNVGTDHVLVSSSQSRTKRPRTIYYKEVRRRVCNNGSAIDALRKILGIP